MVRGKKKAYSKDKSKTKKYCTKRRTKDLDAIYENMRRGKHETPIDLDLPGQGQFLCVSCDRFFIGEDALKTHFKSKPHKKRLKALAVPPYAGPKEEGIEKVDNGPPLHNDKPSQETMLQQE